MTKKRQKATPAFLRRVAVAYRRALVLGIGHVDYIREEFGPMGHSTAARYAQLVRDGGYLDEPATVTPINSRRAS